MIPLPSNRGVYCTTMSGELQMVAIDSRGRVIAAVSLDALQTAASKLQEMANAHLHVLLDAADPRIAEVPAPARPALSVVMGGGRATRTRRRAAPALTLDRGGLSRPRMGQRA